MRQLFLDSANLEEIIAIANTNAIAGVTTNPSLMAKEAKGDYLERLKEICGVLEGSGPEKQHLSVEVTTLDPIEMGDQACALWNELSDFGGLELYIKIPVMFETLPTISYLSLQEGINVNATACMTAAQAKLASDAGAQIVSFFYNRMIDGAVSEYTIRNGNAEVDPRHLAGARFGAQEQISAFNSFKDSETRVICGSIRRASDVLECWNAGSDIVTASTKVIREMLFHPKTDEAIQQFQRDIDAWLK